MENAAKALLISGGVLIAIIILSIGVYLFSTYRDFGTSYEQTLEANEISKFNSNFIKFEGRTDITAQEIVSIINYVKEYEENSEHMINIIVPGYNKDFISENSISFITNNTVDNKGNKIEFTCNPIDYDEQSGIVNKIEFVKTINKKI